MLEGVTSKLEQHASALTALIEIYSRFNESDRKGQMISWWTSSAGLMNELKNDFSNFQMGGESLIKYKLLDSGHLYSTLFKLGAILWGAGELGIYSKYKSLGGKVAKISALMALALPGSGPQGFGADTTGPSTGGYFQAPERGSYQGRSNMGTPVKGY